MGQPAAAIAHTATTEQCAVKCGLDNNFELFRHLFVYLYSDRWHVADKRDTTQTERQRKLHTAQKPTPHHHTSSKTEVSESVSVYSVLTCTERGSWSSIILCHSWLDVKFLSRTVTSRQWVMLVHTCTGLWTQTLKPKQLETQLRNFHENLWACHTNNDTQLRYNQVAISMID